MKATVEVKDRQEAAAIKAALGDTVTRAVTVVVGTLLQLPSDRSRARVLAFVKDCLEEEAERANAPSEN